MKLYLTSDLFLLMPSRCQSQACIPVENKCDFVDDCGDGYDESSDTCQAYTRCDFEHNMCQWSQDRTDNFDWKRQSGSTPSGGTGPTYDHTLGTSGGHFVYIESSRPQSPGDKARLISPVFQASTDQPYCTMKLFYHIYGGQAGTFTIYTRTAVNGNLVRKFYRNLEVGNFWVSTRVPIYSTSPFQVVIEATVGDGSMGDIAMDDISFSPECMMYDGQFPTAAPALASTTPSPCTDPSQWQCQDGSACIPSYEVCDFTAQCVDKSDELVCGACNFDQTTCGWTDISTDRFVWEQHTPGSAAAVVGPAQDHTSGTGKYMYVDATSSTVYGRALMMSPTYGRIAAGCKINFWVYKQTAGVVRLLLVPPGQSPVTGTRSVLWMKLNGLGNQWVNATAGLSSLAPGYRLVFEYMAVGQSGDIAVDDVSFSPECALGAQETACSADQFHCSSGICVDRTKLCDYSNDCYDYSDEQDCASYLRCNFETELCMWFQDQTDVFDWTRQRGASTNPGTGPDRDHTLGNETGSYMYMNSASPRRPNDTARLISQVFRPTGSRTCTMRLFYHMMGNDVNALNIYIETSYTGLRTRLLSIQGQQGDTWRKTMINIVSGRNFRVVIEGTTASAGHGDIGLDDVSFTPGCLLAVDGTLPPALPTGSGQCPAGQFLCGATCRPTSIICDFVHDCPDNSDEAGCPYTCNYENGDLCRWTNQASGNAANWTVSAPSGSGAPVTDHNPGTTMGHFALVNIPFSQFRLANSRLVSPMFSSGGPACSFNFWYMYNGYGIGHFYLFARVGGQDKLIWQIPNSNAAVDVWHNASAHLPSCVRNFQLVFEVQAYRHGYVAVDDFAFKNCGVQVSNILVSCDSSTHFQCGNGQCITLEQVCDLQSDCCDGSDETPNLCYQYKAIDFEQDLGGFIQLTDDNFNWTRQQGPTGTVGTGPSQDHTFGSASGHYLYIESSPPRIANDIARIAYDLPAPQKNTMCKMRYFYHMYGNHAGGLRIYSRDLAGNQITYESIFLDHGDQWLRGEVTFDPDTPFRVIIEGVIGIGHLSDIAIDDVTFTPECNVGSPTPPPLLATTTPAASAGSSVSVSGTTVPIVTPPPCSASQFQCSNGACIDSSKQCDFAADCSDSSDETVCHTYGVCTFSTDYCGWLEQVPDARIWRRVQHGNVTSEGAPSLDADRISQGYFLWLSDTTNHYAAAQRVDLLASPTFNAAGAQCVVQFSYYVQGSNPSFLVLSITGFLVNNYELWRSTGTTSNMWAHMSVSIGRRSHPFTLTFSRLDVTGMSGTIAIDNIQFSNCRLPLIRQACPDLSMFQCSNGACIDRNRLCDNVDDCGDQSDEDGSPLCNPYRKFEFEPDIGDFTQGVNGAEDQFDWQLFDSQSEHLEMPLDHTTGAPSGHYVYFWANENTHIGDTAWLISHPIAGVTGDNTCNVRFYYYIYGTSNHRIDIKLRYYSSGPGGEPVWTMSESQGAIWQRANVQLTSLKPFQFIIEGRLEGSSYGIAIDDISLTPGCAYFANPLPSPPVTAMVTSMATTMQPRCSSGQFQCTSTLQCVDMSRRCDHHVDCPGDNSDEIGCGKCLSIFP